MKKTRFILTLGVVLMGTALPASIYAQENFASDQEESWDEWSEWDEMDDFDSIFSDASDIEDAEESVPVTPVSVSTDSKSAISFSGSVSANLEGIALFAPAQNPSFRLTPAASFSSSLNFTARPSSDLIIHGGISTSFPNFNLSLSSLYADYTMFGKMYITLGNIKPAWGNAFIFDTNILDDSAQDKLNSNDVVSFISGPGNSSRANFSVIATVPFKAGQFIALAQQEGTALSKNNLSYAASVEYPFFGFSFTAFAKTWTQASKSNGTHKNPAAGLAVTGDLGDWHINLWGAANVQASFANPEFKYGRFVAGVARYWDANPKMAVNAEYEFICDNQGAVPEYSNRLGVKYALSHLGGSVYSPSFQAYLNVNKLYGAVIPAVTVSGVSGLPYAKLNLTMPVFFGNQTVTYEGMSITSTNKAPAILFGAVLSISASY